MSVNDTQMYAVLVTMQFIIIKQMKAFTQIFWNAFFPCTNPDWNVLREDTIKCDNVESFRAALRKSD